MSRPICSSYVPGTTFYISVDQGTTNFVSGGPNAPYGNYVNLGTDSSQWLQFKLDSECKLYDTAGGIYRAFPADTAFLSRSTSSEAYGQQVSVTCSITAGATPVQSKITCYPTSAPSVNIFANYGGSIILVTPDDKDYTTYTGTAIFIV